MCAYSIIVGDTISTVLAQYISPDFFAYSFLTSRNVIICLTTFLIILPLSLNRDISKVCVYFILIIDFIFIRDIYIYIISRNIYLTIHIIIYN